MVKQLFRNKPHKLNIYVWEFYVFGDIVVIIYEDTHCML